MKALYLPASVEITVVIFIFTIAIHPVLATTPFCDQHFDHGPTLGETIGKMQCNNPIHQLNYKGDKLIVSNMMKKTTFKVGENITVVPELTNIGNHNVTINYCGPLFVTLTMDQSGKIIFPRYAWGCPLIGYNMTLVPNLPTSGDSYGQNILLSHAGNYTIISLATFGNIPNAAVLWSEPTKITIIPEDYVENKTEYGDNYSNTNLQASIQNCTEPFVSDGNSEIEEMREKVKPIVLADPRVQKILEGKPCEFMAFDMVGFKTAPNETLNTYPEIHINVNGTTELSAVVDLNKNSVIGLSTALLHRLGGTVDPYSSMWYVFAGISVSIAAAISVFILRKKK
ncbi:MAG: hypothetical protein KGI25_09200 [Thaumarchaeota archaeon]|nr:hypothetical protein [Nitrososphaerota archaeon]